ncbi:hypothetical protein HZS_6845 [Henneguya salminicola]|nr:hypothetical protein HZS_6845 [Henneguya salminicola]
MNWKFLKENNLILFLVNSDEKSGIMIGSWKSWPQSSFINNDCSLNVFRSYLKDKKPVEFGQCIDFNLILCSLMRMLGIGCRIAVSENILKQPKINSLPICVNENNLKQINSDLVKWLSLYSNIRNFHSWCNVFLRRVDLQENSIYKSGWQFIDGTPLDFPKDDYINRDKTMKNIFSYRYF